MKILVALFVVLLVLGALAEQSPAPTQPEPEPDRLLTVSVLRALNTAEVTYASEAGRFGTLEELKPVLTRWQAGPQQTAFNGAAKLLNADASDPLPGWELRVVASPDGKHYTLSVKNKQHCDVNAFSDETGVIYLGSALGCDRKPPASAPAP
jgi:hypothetical protein